MTEQFILTYVPQRIKQLRYSKYHLKYRDLVIEANSTQVILAYNELYFIVDDPPGLTVDSDYGLFDSTDNPIPDSVHQHRGEIVITNPGAAKRRIKFIQVIIVN
jgi:hypothetical protein